MADTYWRDLLRAGGSGGGPGAAHGGDDPNNGLDGRAPPGGWGDLPAWEDAQSQAAVDAYDLRNNPAPAAAPATGAMPFDENARAGNLYAGGFVPVINYGWANQGNPGLQASANPYAGYSTGQRQLDAGLGTLYGKPEDAALAGSGAGGTTAPPDAAPTSSTTPPAAYGGGGGGGGERTSGGGMGGGGGANGMDSRLNRFLYGV